MQFKEISSKPSCKDGNARFQPVPLKCELAYFLIVGFLQKRLADFYCKKTYINDQN